jgi:hypothetical protein
VGVCVYGTKARREGVSITYQFATQQLPAEGPLSHVERFSKIPAVFRVQRGLRLKQAAFFTCDVAECNRIGATPFVKKIGLLKGHFSVPDSHPEAALLVTCGDDHPQVISELNRRLDAARLRPEENVSILTWYHERPDAWAFHQRTPRAPILFNYCIRNRPRHIYNPSRIYSDNFYGLTPSKIVPAPAWLAALNCTAVCIEIMAHSRNQGSGLAKIQLFEYRQVAVPDLRWCQANTVASFCALGLELLERPHLADATVKRIDEAIAAEFADPILNPSRLAELLSECDTKARRSKR